MLLAAVVVAGAAAAGIAEVQDDATDREALRLVLAQMETTAHHQSTLEWQAIAEQQLTPTVAQAWREVSEAGQRLSEELTVRDPGGAEARNVRDAWGRYHVVVEREFDLLAQQRLIDAEHLEDEQVDPAFDRLYTALSDADRRYQVLAMQARHKADRATTLILLSAAALIGGLVWRYQRARSRAFDRVTYQALHDGLTGLPNRILLYERIGQAILQADQDHVCAGLLLIDLDRFKEINDTLGHHYGDRLLVEVAERMRGALRQVDTVARLGGDEFAVLLAKMATVEGVAAVAAKLQAALQAPVLLDGLNLNVEASIGAALFPEHGMDADGLLQRADIAMYAAKASQSGFTLFDPSFDHHSPRRLDLLGQLRRAIDEGELVLHYQPKIDTRTHRVLGVESLVRWQHPDHGLIAPAEFIPLAEHSGLITPLTHFVLDAALRQSRSWAMAGDELTVAVNLSARRLVDLTFPDEVAELLARWHVPGRLLELEITESAIMTDPAHALEVLQRLDAMGVHLSIDDFGTGYSSMAYLKDLPVHEIKVDRTFVSQMTSNTSDAVIVRSTVDLGRNLGLRVVAEGVEDGDTWQALNELGCDAVQGYYISRPVPPEDLIEWLHLQQTTAPTQAQQALH